MVAKGGNCHLQAVRAPAHVLVQTGAAPVLGVDPAVDGAFTAGVAERLLGDGYSHRGIPSAHSSHPLAPHARGALRANPAGLAHLLSVVRVGEVLAASAHDGVLLAWLAAEALKDGAVDVN